MISPRAIKAFLGRVFKDSNKTKKKPRKAIEQYIAKLKVKPRKWDEEMWTHQLACFTLGIRYRTYLFFLDMGLGKTRIVLEVFDYRRRRDDAKRLLVLVPNTTNIFGWMDQVKEHTPHLKCTGLTPYLTPAAKQDAVVDLDVDVLVSTYAGFMHLVCRKVDKKKKGKTVRRMVIHDPTLKKIASTFDVVVYDESTMLRTHGRQSLPTRIATHLTKHIKCRYALTGTPFGKKVESLWSQFRVIDDGETLGKTLGLFRAAFFTEKKGYFGGYTYTFDKRKEGLLHRVCRNRSIRYASEECLDLPQAVPSVREVVMPESTWKYQQKIVEDLREARGNFTLVENAWCRLRQLTSGYLPVVDPEGERVTIEFKDNPKLEALIADLHEVPEGSKVLVFNEYIKTGEIICAALKKEKIKHERIYGGTSSKDKKIEKFRDDPSVRVLVINSASGAFGLNLQVANYVAFYESPVDPIIRRQAWKRAHRGGQTKPVFVIDYAVRGSVDVQILKSQAQGRDLFQSIVEGDTDLVSLMVRI